MLQTHVPKLIPVVEDEAFRFGCNAVVVGKTVVHNSRCPELAASLTRAGYRPIEVELDEFLKAGGSAKCLTLRLDGEEAAAGNESNGRNEPTVRPRVSVLNHKPRWWLVTATIQTHPGQHRQYREKVACDTQVEPDRPFEIVLRKLFPLFVLDSRELRLANSCFLALLHENRVVVDIEVDSPLHPETINDLNQDE